ncbi:MAG: hypothetical protein NT000_12870 [Proteobacteria bacterium]|nr:hypothetical protein [Pseudomonadota bacterium]
MTYLTIFIFIFAIPFHFLVAKTEESTGASLTHSNASTEKTHELLPSSPFADCEGQVSLLAKKYYGDSRSANFFHRMIACAGMEGDPLKRKGWKQHLPICPATPPEGNRWTKDWNSAVEKYHVCADSCFKLSAKRSWKEIIHEERKELAGIPKNLKKYFNWYDKLSGEEITILNRHYPGQQCCYHKAKLVTDGPGAGTPDIIFLAPGKTPKRLPRTGPLRAALMHERFDIEIIKENFPNWPNGWKDYWKLGWAPTPTAGEKNWGFDSTNRSCKGFQ